MKNDSLQNFLKTEVNLFKQISDEKLEYLIKASKLQTYEVNEAVVHFGEKVTFFGVVIEGIMSSSIVGEGGLRKELSQFHPRDTFGEIALMSEENYLTDLIASTPGQVLRIPVAIFKSIIAIQPEALNLISNTIKERLKYIIADPEKSDTAFYGSTDPYGLQLKGERHEKILVINCGSSSLKYSYFDSENESNQVNGQVERIGLPNTLLVHQGKSGKITRDLSGGGFKEAFEAFLKELTSSENGVINDPSEITVVGHRVVHGGERFNEAVVINDEILKELEALSPLAPLHNPVNIAGIKAGQQVFPAVPHVAVFDTSFHSTLPSYAFLYGLPYKFYEEQKVRRYGFHGSSHAYISLKTAEYLKHRVNELKIVSCHLGNGASLCAIEHGRSIDTTMGFTPGEGLIMGTRCGDLDAGVVSYLERELGISGTEIDNILNKESGLLGLSGISSDMREVEKAAENSEVRALVALKAFTYRIRKYIGSYVAAMGGVDVLVFTGGIGQGSAGVRSLAVQGLESMGIHLDEQRNREARGFSECCLISTDDSPVTVLIVPTDEERMIARDSLRSINRSYLKDIVKTQQNEPISLEVIAHRVYLSEQHVEALFGAGYRLTKKSELSQPGRFICNEQLTVIGPKGEIVKVPIHGPTVSETQVDITMTEQFVLGIHPPSRERGDIKGTPGCTLEGPAGKLTLDKGVISLLRHIHMTPLDALRYGVKDRSVVNVRVVGDQVVSFGDVLIRVNPDYRLAMFIDIDEANEAKLKTDSQVFIQEIKKLG
jgi:acetate kinase